MENAGVALAAPQLVSVTHPFHPYGGRQAVCVGMRANRAGKRLLLRFEDGTICSVPPQWTDLTAPDPVVVMGRGRAVARFADLIELASLVARLGSWGRSTAPAMCKEKFVATVKPITPQNR